MRHSTCWYPICRHITWVPASVLPRLRRWNAGGAVRALWIGHERSRGRGRPRRSPIIGPFFSTRYDAKETRNAPDPQQTVLGGPHFAVLHYRGCAAVRLERHLVRLSQE